MLGGMKKEKEKEKLVMIRKRKSCAIEQRVRTKKKRQELKPTFPGRLAVSIILHFSSTMQGRRQGPSRQVARLSMRVLRERALREPSWEPCSWGDLSDVLVM
jgi:hypothetical protein